MTSLACIFHQSNGLETKTMSTIRHVPAFMDLTTTSRVHKLSVAVITWLTMQKAYNRLLPATDSFSTAAINVQTR